MLNRGLLEVASYGNFWSSGVMELGVGLGEYNLQLDNQIICVMEIVGKIPVVLTLPNDLDMPARLKHSFPITPTLQNSSTPDALSHNLVADKLRLGPLCPDF